MKVKATWLATEQSVAPTVTSKWSKGYGGPSSGAEWANMAIECEFQFYENHPQDSRVTEQELCPTVTSRWGTGGGNIPLVVFNHHMQDGRITESNGISQTILGRDGESGSLPLVVMNPHEYSSFKKEDVIGTITTQIGKGVTGSQPLVLMDAYQHHGYRENDTVGTLTAGLSKGLRGDTPLVLMDQGGGVMTVEEDIVGTLRAQTHGHEPVVLQHEIYPLKLANALRTNDKPDGGCGVGNDGEPMFTLTTSCSSCGIAEIEAYRISSDASNVMRSSNPNTGFKKADISPTLDTVDPSPAKGQGGLVIVVAENVIGRSEKNGPQGKGWTEDKCFTLNSTGVHAVLENESFSSLKGSNQDMKTEARVRKLTPVECERLQGFPDNWTRIPYRGKDEENCPDSPRYKAIGNSWCVPCVRWIGERIKAQLEKGNNE